jgi:phosphatidyl-myo-inositol alpha-mannosyltransferase
MLSIFSIIENKFDRDDLKCKLDTSACQYLIVKIMKIAIFSALLPEPNRKPGGVEIAAHGLANELTKKPEDEIYVFSLRPLPSDALYRHEQLFSNISWLKTKIGTCFILPFLLNFVDFRAFDIVHLHGDDWFYIHRVTPSVRTLHGSAWNESKTATSLKRKLAQAIIYPLEHLSAQLATLSLAVGADTEKIYHLDCKIDNGVDLEKFYPGAKTLDPSILFVGTWQGRKRGEFIFDNFIKYVLPKHPHAMLWMAIDFCPSHPNVVDLKFPKDEDLAKLFRQAWIFACPSIYEGFGIPYVEALASGTAIISSSNTGAKYILDDGRYGVIADDDSFGQCLIELIENVDKRATLSQIGLARARYFSWEVVAEKHREIYRKALTLFDK